MRRYLTVLLCLVLFGTWLSAFLDATPEPRRAFDCDLAGVWRLGTSNLMVVTPSDNTGWNYAITVFIYEDPTIGGMFPEAVARSSFVGVATQTERDAFEFTVEALGQYGFGQLVYRETISGEMLQSDCDTLVLRSRTIFTGPDGSEILCVPFASSFQRMRVEAPCGELPPFPE